MESGSGTWLVVPGPRHWKIRRRSWRLSGCIESKLPTLGTCLSKYGDLFWLREAEVVAGDTVGNTVGAREELRSELARLGGHHSDSQVFELRRR